MNNDTGLLLIIGIVVVGIAAIFLLDGGTGPVLAPVVDAGPDMVVSECATVRVGCEGYDPEGGAVSYQWTASRGSFDYSHVLNPMYTAPTTCGLGEDVVLTLTVTNEHAVISRDSLVVRVTDTVQCVSLSTCPATVSCSASLMTPSRPAVSRPHALPQQMPLYTPAPVVRPLVPAVCVPTPEVRPCPVPCLTPCSTCPPPPIPPRPTVCPTPCQIPCSTCLPPQVPPRPTVCPTPCQIPCSTCPPPLVSTCPTLCPSPCPTETVVEGGSIQLRGAVWDPDSNLANHYWAADKGRFDDRSSLNPIYYAPMTANPFGEDVCITLTAVDSCGATTVSRTVLHIRNANQPPVVDAGGNFTIGVCSSIQLAAFASDPDRDQLTYCWSAAYGRGQFSDSTALRPVYTAPSVAACEGERITLTLTVTDASGARSSDSLILLVTN